MCVYMFVYAQIHFFHLNPDFTDSWQVFEALHLFLSVCMREESSPFCNTIDCGGLFVSPVFYAPCPQVSQVLANISIIRLLFS